MLNQTVKHTALFFCMNFLQALLIKFVQKSMYCFKMSFYLISQIIKMLTEKCRNQEAMIEEFELREQEFQEILSETEMLRSQTESMR